MRKIDGLDCILLIDDDDSNNYLNRLVIKKAKIDVSVQVALNGLEALEFLTCTGKFASEEKFPKPGIIFLDINMPLMNGWEFLEEYEKLPEEQKGKYIVIMLTASLNKDDMAKAESNQSLKSFIKKPLRVEKLIEIVKEFF